LRWARLKGANKQGVIDCSNSLEKFRRDDVKKAYVYFEKEIPNDFRVLPNF